MADGGAARAARAAFEFSATFWRVAAETLFTTDLGVGDKAGRAVELHRLPHDPRSPLRAWDAADELALAHVADAVGAPDAGRWLVVNDLFGALAVCLHHRSPASWGDSVVSHRATAANLQRNELDSTSVELVPSTGRPPGPIDVAIVKIPRSLALLEDQLRSLRPLLHVQSVVVGAGMVKAIHRSTIELFETIIGPSPTSLAKKKARLILSSFDPALNVGENPFPSRYQLDSGHAVVEFANVFSRGRLDIGTRAMLDHLPSVAPGARALDLGCGNGVLGLSLGVNSKLSSLTLVDESYHAVASAQRNAHEWGLSEITDVRASHTLSFMDDGVVDIVVNNPPFHTHQSRTDDTARAMFRDARRVLTPGGRLIVVGNRHLGYHKVLDKMFDRCEVIGSSPKFVVLEARR